MAKLEALQGGKAVSFCQNVDMPAAVELFRYYAGWIDKSEGESFIDNVDGFIKVCIFSA